jgi:hypothetical protein
MKTLRLLITCIILLFAMNSTGARPRTGPEHTMTNHSVAFTNRMVTMTPQEYCDKLAAIFDNMTVFRTGMLTDFKAAYLAKPRTWGIIAKYRKYLQDYCQVNLTYLSELPHVGDANDFDYSLSVVIYDNEDLAAICQEFEKLKPDTAGEVVNEIFNRLVDKKDKMDIASAVFYAKRTLYQMKYGLPIK